MQRGKGNYLQVFKNARGEKILFKLTNLGPPPTSTSRHLAQMKAGKQRECERTYEVLDRGKKTVIH